MSTELQKVNTQLSQSKTYSNLLKEGTPVLFNKEIITGDYLQAGRSQSLEKICAEKDGQLICETLITVLLNELKQVVKTFYDGNNINTFVKMIIYNHPDLKINELILAINKGVSREYAEPGKPAVYGEVTYDLIVEWIEKFKVRQEEIFYQEHLNKKNGRPIFQDLVAIAKDAKDKEENREVIDSIIQIGKEIGKEKPPIANAPIIPEKKSTDPFKKYFTEFDDIHSKQWKDKEIPGGFRFIKYQNEYMDMQKYVTARYNEDSQPKKNKKTK